MSGALLAAANDQFRAYPETGVVIVTQGVAACGPDFQLAALDAVKRFDGFANEDDAYGSHDFGIVTVDGQRLYWKIDLFLHENRGLGLDDPLDIDAGRSLTIMLPEEY